MVRALPYAEYLATEAKSQVRHDYVDGEVFRDGGWLDFPRVDYFAKPSASFRRH
jgi:hypothetical protein